MRPQVRNELIKFLKTSQELRDYVGDRIYPMMLPIGSQGPAVVVSKNSQTWAESHDGIGSTGEASFGVTVVALSVTIVDLVKDIIIDMLAGKDFTSGGVRCCCWLDDDMDVIDEALVQTEQFAGAVEIKIDFELVED
jgi:hypothetical protein